METNMDLTMRRRFFAEEIEAVCKLRSSELVDAFASVPRERFLGPGPWIVLGEGEAMLSMAMWRGGSGEPIKLRTTPDADPARVYHNIAVAIDAERQLFNGQPAAIATWIDALELKRGASILHIGSGLGYYTGVMAHCVGPNGRVVAYEVDEMLAADARRNLASMPWVEVRHGDASQPLGERFDAVVVHAGVTHPLDDWLDALRAGGRLILPLTTTMGSMAPTIGKGLLFLVTNTADGLSARVLSVIAIYSAIGVRDESVSARFAATMAKMPMAWQGVKRLRRDRHDESLACWLHAPTFCLSS
jgi:protein-L-isoaspartate(D-aspartate) O-methyltransferase